MAFSWGKKEEATAKVAEIIKASGPNPAVIPPEKLETSAPIEVVFRGPVSKWPREDTEHVIRIVRTELEEETPELAPQPSQFYFPEEVHQQLQEQFCFLTGKAGSGKTTLLRQEGAAHPNYIELGSTTGIAAINCGGRTVNSLLKYYNTESLEVIYNRGKLHERLRLIRARKRVLGIDEASMLPAKQLDIIIAAIGDIMDDPLDDDTLRIGATWDLGVHLVGDLCQLPPVKAEFCFKSRAWDNLFAPNIIKLEKVWRQDNEDFVAAINAMRAGDGKKAVSLLKKCGVRFEKRLDEDFTGTTLIPNNIDVDTFNKKKLDLLKEDTIRIQPIRRGVQAKEWDRFEKRDYKTGKVHIEWGIPFEQRFKVGAYVMILRNDSKDFQFVNGDCGIIEKWDVLNQTFHVRLVRTGEVVQIKMVKQFNYQDEQPDETQFNSMFYPKEDPLTGQWIIGSIEWMPLRLAYASTIHKAQGLTLDRVQIDSRPQFYGYPSMCYVAVSRARTAEGLVIVGSESDFASKVITNKEVLRWV